jgi:hypothetical protein
MKWLKNNTALWLGYAITITLVVANRHHCFFWDTVQLGSKHADFYFSSHFSGLLLPNDIDSGHIPTFGLYIALIWQLFGRTLGASHLAMLPFAIGIVWQISRLCHKFVPARYAGIAGLLILIDPSLLSQITLVSPDVPLVFFFLMGMNAVFENRKPWLTLAVLLLFLTSMRGMMVSVCLLALDLYCNFDWTLHWKKQLQRLVKRSLIYLPALLVFLAFNAYHFLQKGWIGYHKDSPWAKCFEPAGSVKGVLFNVGLYGWRLLDYGRVAVWLVLFILLLIYKKRIVNPKTKVLAFFTMVIVLVLPLNLLWAKNLTGHRYLIPVYLVVSIFTVSLLFSEVVKTKIKIGLASLWFVMIGSGNFWIYPTRISQGWDSTLAHLPYYGLRQEALHYLDQQQIPYADVETFFPNTAPLNLIDLSNDTRHLDTFDGSKTYVFFSNVYNVEDTTLDILVDPSRYKPIQHFESNRVFITIFKRL